MDRQIDLFSARRNSSHRHERTNLAHDLCVTLLLQVSSCIPNEIFLHQNGLFLEVRIDRGQFCDFKKSKLNQNFIHQAKKMHVELTGMMASYVNHATFLCKFRSESFLTSITLVAFHLRFQKPCHGRLAIPKFISTEAFDF